MRLAELGVLEGAPAAVDAVSAPTQAFGSGIPAPIDYENRTNVVAIVAIILGFIVPIGGIIAGAVALAQVKRTREKGRGLAIAGIAIGSAVIVLLTAGVIALFALGLFASTAESQSTPAPVPVPSEPLDPQPTDDQESIDVFSLAVGDCLNAVTSDEVTDVGVFDCAQPHDYEVFAEFDLPGDTFPGADEVDSLADQGCFEAFEPFVGLAYDSSVLDYTYFVPTQDSWETADDRLISCLIGEPGVQTSGSLSGAGR